MLLLFFPVNKQENNPFFIPRAEVLSRIVLWTGLLRVDLMRTGTEHYIRKLAFQKQADYLCIYDVRQI